MKNITIIEGADLHHLADLLGIPTEGIYRIRIAKSDDQIKVKVNEGMWTPALGKADK